MKKWVVFSFLFVLLILPMVYSSPVDEEIKKLTSYAQDYESGNINYAQFVVYISSVRQNLNEELGAISREEGGLFKEQQIESALGKSQRTTKWVWIESEEREKKLETEVPVWEKIVFDGKKIQVRLSAYPSLFKKENEDLLIYRLNFDIRFKSPSKELEIDSEINDVKLLAEEFNEAPSDEMAEKLAKESVNVEKLFESNMRKSSKSCEDVMASIFGSENLRGIQKIQVSEIDFFSGENFEARMRLEMCDDCEWNWINLNMWIEGRGRDFEHFDDFTEENFDRRKYENLELYEYSSKAREIIEEMKRLLSEGNYRESQKLSFELQTLNEAWNEKANNIWEEPDKTYQDKRNEMTPEEEEEFNRNFGWIREEQERRQKEKELRNLNYLDRKDFYEDLFSTYEKKDFYFSQTEYEKRLIEEFAEFGEEICYNNFDDNTDGNVDCSDAQCGGKVCGESKIEIIGEDGEVKITTGQLYCIAGSCQEKEEDPISSQPICGNNICEEGENVCESSEIICEGEECPEVNECGINYCPGDCSICEIHPQIECSGRVLFGGEDENRCPLPPICLIEEEQCTINEDCSQPLCGITECVKENSEDEFGVCEVSDLKECRNSDCIEGDERKKECSSGETIISSICVGGLWKDTGVPCKDGGIEENLNCVSCGDSCFPAGELQTVNCPSSSFSFECIERSGKCEALEISRGHDSCVVREDCGSNNDVCSNGECVTLPEIISVSEEVLTDESYFEDTGVSEENFEKERINEEFGNYAEENSEESSGENFQEINEGGLTGEIISAVKVVTGRIISGFVSHEDEEENSGEGSGDNLNGNNGENFNSEITEEENPEVYEGFQEEFFKDDFEEQRNRDEERFSDEQKNRCEEECSRACADKCVREECSENFECDVDDAVLNCENSCEPDDSCVEKCIGGENFWEDYQDENAHPYEKGVFMVGGSCRDSSQEEWGSNGNIYFGGWGEPFEEIQPLKNKYYRGGGAEWCKNEFEDLLKQRREFEKSFNEEFIHWFFEDYLASSAEDFENHVSGIFELYWKDVDLSREMAFRMQCLGKEELPEINLIGKIEYETPYGSFEFWEEIKEASLPGTDEKMKLISPYMRMGIFPNKEFMKSIMKKSMKEGKFPGPSEDSLERENQEGPTKKEVEMIKQNEKFMNQIIKSTDKYGGNIDAVVQFKDLGNDEIVFNLYAKVNPEIIMEVKPMEYEKVPAEDFRIEIDFDKIYDMILTSEKDIESERLESPPWDRQKIKPVQKIKDVGNGIEMYFKMRSIINSAKVYPESAESDARELFKLFFKMMREGDDRERNFEDGEISNGGQNGKEGDEEFGNKRSFGNE